MQETMLAHLHCASMVKMLQSRNRHINRKSLWKLLVGGALFMLARVFVC